MRRPSVLVVSVLTALALAGPAAHASDPGKGARAASAAAKTTAKTTAKTAAKAAGPVLVARWDMSELNGDPLMRDSSGNGLHGNVGPDAVAQGLTRTTGSYYEWSLRCPACLPAAPDRVVKVPDRGSALDIPDNNIVWSAEIRYWTNKGYGNLMQKGQGATPGGQFKFENPGGRPKCVWIGANTRYVAVQPDIQTNDRVWHTVRCVKRPKSVEIWVDGALALSKKAPLLGPMDNTTPFVVGGKAKCDNVKITCDYYTGRIDYVQVTHG